MNRWALLCGAIVTEVAAAMSLKAAVDGASAGRASAGRAAVDGAAVDGAAVDGAAVEGVGFGLLAAAGYVAAFLCLSTLLRRGEPIGVIYSVWSAAGVVLTAVLAVLLFEERLSWTTAAGIAVVVAGVVLVETGRGRAPAEEAR